MTNYRPIFEALGGDSSTALREWERMVRCVTRDENLYNLAYSELYARLFLHFNHIYPNVLLLAAILHASTMNVPLSDRDESLWHSLKTEAPKHRAQMLIFMSGVAWSTIGPFGRSTTKVSVPALINARCSRLP